MTIKTHFISAALTLLMLPIIAVAQAAPSPVTGVDANVLGDEVVVQWDPVTSDPIEYYRVYYSSESILNNDGLYDDFEVTEGDNTTLTFIPPGGGLLYVAVIAVATSGLESEFFTEEDMVELEAKDLPPTGVFKDVDDDAPPPPLKPPADTSKVRLLKGTVTSPTEIVIEFSSSLTVEADRAPEGLKIEAPGGKKLQIKSIIIDAKTVTIKTVTQTKGTVYNVQFSEPFEGKSGQPLDADDRSVLVTGHAEGADAPPPPPPGRVANPQEPPDLQNVTIVPQIQQNGAYTITLEWEPVDNTPGDLYGIIAYQTRDGQTFGPPGLLPIDVRGVTLNDVTPGFFGIYLQTANMYGYTSPGVFQYVTLPTYVPGYGFYGDLTFGSAGADGSPTEDLSEKQEIPVEEMAELAPVADDAPMHTLEGVDHSATYKSATRINWQRALILASSVAGVFVVVIGGFVIATKNNGSVPQ